MPLQLKSVEAARGWRWIADAFRLFARRPFGLTLMFAVFFAAAALAAALLPFVGSLLQLMSLPMLSLGFMVASQSALLDGPVHPVQFVAPLRADAQRRRALLWLCGIYGLAALAILLLCVWVSDDALTRLQLLLVQGEKARGEIDALLAEPGVATGALLLALLGSALTVPFWHAPALVHWGGQSVGQALFSSTLALWRSKGAFLVYFLGWGALIALFGFGTAMLASALGAAQLVTVLALPAGVAFSTVFYVSLIFTFNDSFAGAPTGRDAPIDTGLGSGP